MLLLFFLSDFQGSSMPDVHFLHYFYALSDRYPVRSCNKLQYGSVEPLLVCLYAEINFEVVDSQTRNGVSSTISDILFLLLHDLDPWLFFVTQIIDLCCLRPLYNSIANILEPIFLIQSFVPFKTVFDFILESTVIISSLMTNFV